VRCVAEHVYGGFEERVWCRKVRCAALHSREEHPLRRRVNNAASRRRADEWDFIKGTKLKREDYRLGQLMQRQGQQRDNAGYARLGEDAGTGILIPSTFQPLIIRLESAGDGEIRPFGNNYNPDVLECLADLSNDGVFTPPKVVNQTLDLLPQGLKVDCGFGKANSGFAGTARPHFRQEDLRNRHHWTDGVDATP
ncbi:MAG: hypothetical protein IIZ06_06835, partial [Kiritimatiellae bacterium]|nr:hypothetical protein [Kiritimatiellia bacterium]